MRRDRCQSSDGFDAFFRAALKKFICARTPTTHKDWLTHADSASNAYPRRGPVNCRFGVEAAMRRNSNAIPCQRGERPGVQSLPRGPACGVEGPRRYWLTCFRASSSVFEHLSAPFRTLTRSRLTSVECTGSPGRRRVASWAKYARHSATDRLAHVFLACIHTCLRLISQSVPYGSTSRGTSIWSLSHNSSAVSYTPIPCTCAHRSSTLPQRQQRKH